MFQLPFVSKAKYNDLANENRRLCRQLNDLLMDRIKIKVAKKRGRLFGSKNKKAKKK
jgi:hypothetical protein